MTSRILPSLILGHRGSPLRATENTLRSLALALEEGADGVEVDIHRTLDGDGAVIHDETLDRTMGLSGVVAKLSMPAITRMTNGRVPSLDQVTAWAAASDAWLNVELKSAGVERRLANRIRQTDLIDRVIVSSFDPRILNAVRSADPEIRRFLLTERWDEEAMRRFGSCGAVGVCLGLAEATEANLQKLRERDVPTIVWTVNAPEEIRRLLTAEVAGIITDDPGTAVRIRGELDT